MIEYNKEMLCSESACNELNEVVDNINQHLGENVYEVLSTEGYEDERVDVIEGAHIDSCFLTFEEATTYLKGIEKGILIKEEYSV